MSPSAAELAQIDQRLAAQGLDISPAGDTATGTLSLLHDPVRVGVTPKMTGSVSVAAGTLGTGPGGGTLICTGSTPTYTVARTRRVRFSMLELARSFPNISGGVIHQGNTPVVDPASGGITQAPSNAPGFAAFPDAQITLPISKPHHRATITSVALYFFFPIFSGVMFGASGQITLQRIHNVTGAITSYGPSTAVPTVPQNQFSTAYAATISGLAVVVDLTTYVYRIVLQDIKTTGSVTVVWTGGEVNYSGIADEEFSQ
jgi:hypothetical protein